MTYVKSNQHVHNYARRVFRGPRQPGHGRKCRIYVLSHLTIIIKQLADTNNILTYKVKTRTATNTHITVNEGVIRK